MDEAYAQAPGLVCERSGLVLEVAIDRPSKRNALTDEIVAGLIEILSRAGNDESVRAIHLSGSGEDFCSGFDIVDRNADVATRPRVGSIQRRLPGQASRLITLMRRTQVPIVCEVRGWAAGIGLALALAADFTVAADDARFWAPFVERGFTPDSGVSSMLPSRIGEVRAREMLILGRVVSGEEAVDWNMIHQSVSGDRLRDVAQELTTTLADSATVAVGLTKALLDSASATSLEAQMHEEALSLELSSRSEDFREGLSAFGERRPPTFKGR